MDANPWAIHHGDAQFTGRSRFSGPQLGQIEWRVKIPTTNLTHDSFLSPIIGRDSTIYFVSYKDTASPGSFLYAMKFDGTIKWSFPIESPTAKNSSPPIISSEGTIYVADWASNLTAIKNDGTMKWKLTLSRAITSMMNLDKEGNLYGFASDGILYCFSPSGNIKWSLTLDNFGSSSSAVVFSPDGNTMYVTGRNLYAVSRTGELKWSFDGPGEGTQDGTPLVNTLGDIFIFSGIYLIRSDGTLKYVYVDSSGFIPHDWDPTIDKLGNIYIGGYNGIISLNYKGELRWRKSYDLHYAFGLISDKNGIVYFLTTDNKLTSIDSLGNMKWQLLLDGKSYYSPAITEGRMYLGTVQGTAKYFYSIK